MNKTELQIKKLAVDNLHIVKHNLSIIAENVTTEEILKTVNTTQGIVKATLDYLQLLK